jgi:hypothetical protein
MAFSFIEYRSQSSWRFHGRLSVFGQTSLPFLTRITALYSLIIGKCKSSLQIVWCNARGKEIPKQGFAKNKEIPKQTEIQCSLELVRVCAAILHWQIILRNGGENRHQGFDVLHRNDNEASINFNRLESEKRLETTINLSKPWSPAGAA